MNQRLEREIMNDIKSIPDFINSKYYSHKSLFNYIHQTNGSFYHSIRMCCEFELLTDMEIEELYFDIVMDMSKVAEYSLPELIPAYYNHFIKFTNHLEKVSAQEECYEVSKNLMTLGDYLTGKNKLNDDNY